MKTISNYSIYCTEAQTKKALELGAPINLHPFHSSVIKGNERLFEHIVCIDDKYYCSPTTEQMISWLEEQTILVIIEYVNNNKTWFYSIINSENNYKNKYRDFVSRKEATLVSIDEALDYLISNKK